MLPNPDGVQEVRTTINSYSAKCGRGQGVILVTTKGGANEFHGSAFDHFRNEALNANSFGNDQMSVARPAFKVNTYGGTVGPTAVASGFLPVVLWTIKSNSPSTYRGYCKCTQPAFVQPHPSRL